jgi:hypothetical protein
MSGETIVFQEIALALLPGTLRVLVEATAKSVFVEGEKFKTEITEAQAREDIARAESVVSALLEVAPGFARMVGDRDVEYHAIWDYGMGAIWLAEFRNGQFTWTGPPYDE